jgi:hypothetical protein
LNDPPEQLGEDVDGTKEHLKVEAKCWRRQDIDEMLRRGDDNSLLCKFGLFDDNYAQLQGLEAFSTRREEYPSSSKVWGIDLSQLVDEKPAVIARKLSEESFNKFRNVPYEEFIRKAAGFSSDCIDYFLWSYELLEWKWYTKVPVHLSFQVKEVSRFLPLLVHLSL